VLPASISLHGKNFLSRPLPTRRRQPPTEAGKGVLCQSCHFGPMVLRVLWLRIAELNTEGSDQLIALSERRQPLTQPSQAVKKRRRQ
jgi:hypothetical protein